MATKTHKKRIKTELCDYFELKFHFTFRKRQIPVPTPGKAFYFVPLVPFCGHFNCGI
jgi:hypothetical protein